MPTPFDNLSASRAKTLIADATSDGQAASRAYYNGDHWQGGNGWIGPLPAVTDANSAQVLADIQRNFVARNASAKRCCVIWLAWSGRSRSGIWSCGVRWQKAKSRPSRSRR
jgi:hypothetical protein